VRTLVKLNFYSYRLLGGTGLLLDETQMLFYLVKVIEGDRELVKVLGEFSSQIFFHDP